MKKLCILLLLFVGGSRALCQDYPELKSFQDASGQFSTLFRGTEAIKYNILFNGTYYWDSPEFKKGDVFYDGKFYRDVNMNIDACTQTVIVSYSLTSGFIALDTDKVRYVVMDGVRYDNLNLLGHPELPKGFYQIICSNGIKAYRRVDKLLRTSYESANGIHFIGYNDPDYKPAVLDYFYYEPTYYLETEGGKIMKIKGVNTLNKEFPESKNLIKKYYYSHKPAEGRVAENKILKALECLDQLEK